MKRILAATALIFLYNPAYADVVSLTIDSAAVSKSSGISIEAGTVTCTDGDSVFIFSTLTESTNNKFSSASGSTLVVCNGSQQNWQVTNTSFYGNDVGPGQAVGQATASSQMIFRLVQTPITRLNVKNLP
ncbi:MAG: DUF6299 family protein [Methylocystis sp.]|uniref:DUF6299 family protein n=1 Tax=Methylocystis sp. TaxID=1911079 RepID=UPI003DA599E0